MTGLPLDWTPEEKMVVEALNKAADHMVYDLLDHEEKTALAKSYIRQALRTRPVLSRIEPQDEFERGVCAAIGILRHTVHCMNPG